MRRPRFVGMPIVLFGIAWLGVMGLLTMGLWNVLVPDLIRLPAIGYWQALALFVLSRVLFGRHGGGWMRRSRHVRGWHDLTPDQRQRFRRAMGHCPSETLGGGDVAGNA